MRKKRGRGGGGGGMDLSSLKGKEDEEACDFEMGVDFECHRRCGVNEHYR